MQIIDPHHHLWDLERHDYPWLRPETPHPAGELTPICRSYRLDDFLADAAGLELVKSVHLQAEIDRRDPVAETAWLQAVADAPGSRGFPHGIVAFADLADPGVEATLERHCGHANVRGIRYLLNYEAGEPLYCATERGDWLRDPRWRQGYALLANYGLSFDLQIFWQQMEDALDLARAFPETQIILNHTGMPGSATATMSRLGGTACARSPQRPMWPRKSRASAMFHHDWTAEMIRPFVLDTIEVFGTDRCMFASNFPVDKLHADYRAIWHGFDRITADFSEPERRELFHDNAARFYRL